METPDWVARMDHLAAEHVPFLFVLDFELIQPIVIPLSGLTSIHAGSDSPYIKYQIGRTIAAEDNATPVEVAKSPVPFSKYQTGFDQALSAIKAGDTYLINLCYATGLSNQLSLSAIYEKAQAPYKLLVDGKFVVFSPEQFVSVKDGVIRTFPMKGTIDASVPDAEKKLLADIKEQEEHATVVDLLRNDLSIVAEQVTVDQYRFITEIKTGHKTLLQCSSEISGKLNNAYLTKPGSMMHALLPAGSVTGAPKKRTVELIKQIEPEPRNFFTGIFGVFDGKDLDSAVMIRMIEKRNDGYFYRSGGGLTYRSRANQEYQEMIDKVYIPI
jgi:para-aminobenzoate synthetase component 1